MEKLEAPATLANLEKMIGFAIRIARKYGFEGGSITDINLALEEALVNVIKYAYPNNDGMIEITCEPHMLIDGLTIDGITINIIDSGIPFDPTSLPIPDTSLPVEQRKIGGLGVFIIRNSMNEFKYLRENGRNILTLTKLL